MSRNVSDLHPRLQEKANQLIALCAQNGIAIGIGECLRTVTEQDALYAKGRTAGGAIVTNSKGSSFSSQHQWGIAFDVYLKMDVDGDGQTADDAFNNSTGAFNKVGALAKSIGLGWGGDWTSIKDLPHLYLPDWGSTTSQLKSQYGNFAAFKATWGGTPAPVEVDKPTNTVTASKNPTDPAQNMDKSLAKQYTAQSNLNLRRGAGTSKDIITVIPSGEKVTCCGYYTKNGSTIWLYVQYGKYTGFVSKDYVR